MKRVVFFNLRACVDCGGTSPTDDNGSVNTWEMQVELIVYEEER